jgi:ppGpp synthetase/RelA/SpoT-type nucleotidyltranferase
VKSYDSILRKIRRKNIPMTLEGIEENIRDIAGVRVICSFPDDIYELAESFLRQDDITLVERKDYIKNPKESGYRSLHLIVQVPIFLQNTKKLVYVEVQFRTIAMDFWASLEHKLQYKKNIPESQAKFLKDELYDCAQQSAALDKRMQNIRNIIAKSESEEEVKQNWEKLKLKEGNKSVLAGVSKGTPSIVKAFRIQEKVKGIGFDFATAEDAWEKVDEELAEFHAETDLEKKEQELGDVLFSVINYARISNLNADSALERTNVKFINRFKTLEKLALEKNLQLSEMSLQEMDVLWEEAKRIGN